MIDGGTVRLPRIVGRSRAVEIILTGRQVKAKECLALGLCEYIVKNGEFRHKAEELTHQIARVPSDLYAGRQEVCLCSRRSLND